jgi:hypothetical protein
MLEKTAGRQPLGCGVQLEHPGQPAKENNWGELGSHFAERCKMGTQLNTAGGLCLFFAHPTGTESVRIYY